MAFLRAVHEKVNIIPVIGKADALMPKETQALKQKVCLVTSDLWSYMKPEVGIKPELSFDFFDPGITFRKHNVSSYTVGESFRGRWAVSWPKEPCPRRLGIKSLDWMLG